MPIPKVTHEVTINDNVRIADDHEENDHQEQIGTVNNAASTQETNENQVINNQESLNPFQPDRKWLRDHPPELVIGDIEAPVRTRSATFNEAMFASFLSQMEPKKVDEALSDSSWVEAMQEELNQFERSKV